MRRRVFLSCFVAFGSVVFPNASQAISLNTAPDFLLPAPLYHGVAANADVVAQGAEKFITKLADDGIGFLGDQAITQDKQRAEFRKLLTRNFDMNTIARFSLGRHWRVATKQQRDEYMKLFKAMIIDVYSERFKDYQGQQIEVTGSRKEGERDILVHSKLTQESGPDVKVDWRVRKREGRYKVIDIIVEGVSMALTQRSDFSSVVQRGGGNMEALLVHLREN